LQFIFSKRAVLLLTHLRTDNRKILRHTVTYCNTLQQTATRGDQLLLWDTMLYMHPNVNLQHTATNYNTQQHTTLHCNALQRNATHCKVLQRTATYCNILQRNVTHCHSMSLSEALVCKHLCVILFQSCETHSPFLLPLGFVFGSCRSLPRSCTQEISRLLAHSFARFFFVSHTIWRF